MSPLSFQFLQITDLTSEEKHHMLELMCKDYTNLRESVFLNDLSLKQWVLLFRDSNNEIRGFSTLVLNPNNYQNETYDVLYSGDTIIASEFRGSLELMKGFCYASGVIKRINQGKRLFWLLTSKGHSTYLCLTLFSKTYFPDLNQIHPHLKNLVNTICHSIFPDKWDSDKGLLIPSSSDGSLTSELAIRSLTRRHNPQVNYFLNKNPHYHQGHELVCLTELIESNLKRSAKSWFLEGFNNHG